MPKMWRYRPARLPEAKGAKRDKTFTLAALNQTWDYSKAGRTRGKITPQLD